MPSSSPRTMDSSKYSSQRDERIATELKRFVREFQTIEISVTPEDAPAAIHASVHPPYMLQSVTLIDNTEKFQQLAARHRARLQRVRAARENAPDDVKEFLRRHFYDGAGREKHIADGRAPLREIKGLLQAAVDQGVIAPSGGKQQPDSSDLRQWLKTYGIGIDCSGFVQQALQRLIDASVAEMDNISHRDANADVPFLRCGWVYRMITEPAGEPAPLVGPVPTPLQARPGDIAVNRHHMRIVVDIDVDPKAGTIFTLAEATSASDIPEGQEHEEADIGPRFVQVHFPQPDQPIAEQIPRKKRLGDAEFQVDEAENTYVIGRYRQLDQL
ncbi:MAG: hypothetical protein R3C14_15310 [Caldilineaceae bacterium]